MAQDAKYHQLARLGLSCHQCASGCSPEGPRPKYFGGFPELGVPFWGPYDGDYNMLGPILGSTHVGNHDIMSCTVATQTVQI